MANDNCLSGMQCPKCGSLEPFHILGIAVFLVYDEGSSEFTGLDWENGAHCECVACKYAGKVEDFRNET